MRAIPRNITSVSCMERRASSETHAGNAIAIHTRSSVRLSQPCDWLSPSPSQRTLDPPSVATSDGATHVPPLPCSSLACRCGSNGAASSSIHRWSDGCLVRLMPRELRLGRTQIGPSQHLKPADNVPVDHTEPEGVPSTSAAFARAPHSLRDGRSERETDRGACRSAPNVSCSVAPALSWRCCHCGVDTAPMKFSWTRRWCQPGAHRSHDNSMESMPASRRCVCSTDHR
jgi:hypothetical protein